MTERDGEELEPPPRFRPWRGSGVPHPGAARPQGPSVTGVSPDAVPSPPPTVRPRSDLLPQGSRAAHEEGMTRSGRWMPGARAPLATPRPRPVLPTVLAAVIVAGCWLPWLKSSVAGFLDLSGTRFHLTSDLWDLPVTYLWSFRSADPSDLDLGWIVVALGIAAIGLGWIGASRVVRGIGAVVALITVLFWVQVVRAVDDMSARVPGASVPDFVGIGGVVVFAAAVALTLVPGD